jgi:AcrR family transcriptional regulator
LTRKSTSPASLAAKATLYAHYGNKDGLVAAYLDRLSALSQEQLTNLLESDADARQKLLRSSTPSPTGTTKTRLRPPASPSRGLPESKSIRSWPQKSRANYLERGGQGTEGYLAPWN